MKDKVPEGDLGNNTMRMSLGKNDEALDNSSVVKGHVEKEHDMLLPPANRAMGIANLEIGPMLSAVDGEESLYKDNNNTQTQSSGLRLGCEGQDDGPQGKRSNLKRPKERRRVLVFLGN
ncbi:hypothetical protein Ancab_001925 [Ancistrocladus abbreviatus]